MCVNVLNDVLIELFFINGDLTTEKYKATLRNQIFSTIKQVAGEKFAEISRRFSITLW